jgi:aspartyl-tRNA(Asn)/glutamyl-tRNA(Gln) amidotransferase subunit A
VQRLVEAGGTVVGTTNMDEFGMGSATTFSAHGPTYNPFSIQWAAKKRKRNGAGTGSDPSRGWLVPGGSSGGAAVSVAVGACLGAVGSDTGGSVRLPAAFCGVVGFKPTYGRVPRWGLIPYASSLDTVGFLARSVQDVRLLYSLAAGHDPRDDTCIRAKRAELRAERRHAEAFGEEAKKGSKPLAGLRVGIPVEYRVAEVDAATASWWQRGADLLREAGAEIVTVSLPNTAAALPAYYVLAPAEAASNLARYDGVRYGYRSSASPPAADATNGGAGSASSSSAAALHAHYARTRSEGFGPEVQRRILTGNFVLSAGGRGEYYDAAVRARDRVRADFAAVFRAGPLAAQEAVAASPVARANPAAYSRADDAAGVDILLTPVAPTAPWPVDGSPGKATERSGSGRSGNAAAAATDPLAVYVNDVMTIPASLAHLPAVSVPVGSSPLPGADPSLGAVLPVGLQLIGRHCDEETLLRVARVLEARAGFRLPGYVTGRDD